MLTIDTQKAENYAADRRRDYDRKLEKLASSAKWIEEKMARLRENVAQAQRGEPCCINSLGELQGQGPDLDRQCGEVYEAAQELARLEYVFDVDLLPKAGE